MPPLARAHDDPRRGRKEWHPLATRHLVDHPARGLHVLCAYPVGHLEQRVFFRLPVRRILDVDRERVEDVLIRQRFVHDASGEQRAVLQNDLHDNGQERNDDCAQLGCRDRPKAGQQQE